jgi:hypothetical protein
MELFRLSPIFGTDETISKCRTLRSLARRRRLVSEGVE